MARTQQGTGALTVWMIIFVALWLTSTVFLVVLYTGQEELKSDATRLKKSNDQLISSSERSSLDLVQLARPASDGGPTVAGLLEQARSQTAELATGDGTNDVAAVRSTRDRLIHAIVSDKLVTNPSSFEGISLAEGLELLYKAYKKGHALRLAAEDRVADLEAEVDDLVKANTTQKEDFEQRAKALSDQVEEIETGHVAYRTGKDEAVAKIEREFEDRLTQNDTVLTQERQHRAGLEKKNTQLQKRMVSLQERFGALMIGPEKLATARQADGSILTAVPGDEVVYISLGSRDRLTLGLQFTVYSAETGIPQDGHGKARIEVVSISPASAECKKVWVDPRAVILEGDLIANPIYDSKRPLTFLAIGEFDFDHDGRPDPDGTAVVASLIENWGGTVTDRLDALTDFVVAGGAPPKPRLIRNASAEQAQRLQTIQQAWENYQDSLAAAKTLAVPMMTQEVFLNFLGYNNRQATR